MIELQNWQRTLFLFLLLSISLQKFVSSVILLNSFLQLLFFFLSSTIFCLYTFTLATDTGGASSRLPLDRTLRTKSPYAWNVWILFRINFFSFIISFTRAFVSHGISQLIQVHQIYIIHRYKSNVWVRTKLVFHCTKKKIEFSIWRVFVCESESERGQKSPRIFIYNNFFFLSTLWRARVFVGRVCARVCVDIHTIFNFIYTTGYHWWMSIWDGLTDALMWQLSNSDPDTEKLKNLESINRHLNVSKLKINIFLYAKCCLAKVGAQETEYTRSEHQIANENESLFTWWLSIGMRTKQTSAG